MNCYFQKENVAEFKIDGAQRRSEPPTVVAAYARKKELSTILY